ncbi:hypothetical protein COLO4_36311 [Corchorus olitorius]|uniref:Uncharacterized protein n=1 Tax=Corchorus olitorius TaxID=93759 RepID=A0A1R3GA29_9ROSI|nr:hypothetical protein COLO4_36311 [Corchorus olitorius]
MALICSRSQATLGGVRKLSSLGQPLQPTFASRMQSRA